MNEKKNALKIFLIIILLISVIGLIDATNINCFSNAECGRDSFIGNQYCLNSSVYQDFKQNICNNPGTENSSCTFTVSPRIADSCSVGCVNGQCSFIFCSNNADCDDGDTHTLDQCINPGNFTSYCSHIPINCTIDNDCGFTGLTGSEFCFQNDIFKNFQNSTCINPGTSQSYCNVSTSQVFLIDCGVNDCGNFGDNFCENNSVFHSRICNNKGCIQGSCFNQQVIDKQLVSVCSNGCLNGQCIGGGLNITCSCNSQCGTNGFTGNQFCQNNSIFQNFITFLCNNPGTGDSFCSNSTSPQLKNLCTGNHICLNGQCIIQQCIRDSDCGSLSSEKVCSDDELDNKITNPRCINNTCQFITNFEFIKTCDFLCDNGKCVEKEDQQNPENIYAVGNASLKYTDRTRKINLSFINYSTQKISLSNELKNNINFNYFWWGIIVLIVLIIVLIILILMKS